jgi:hypothetical protein
MASFSSMLVVPLVTTTAAKPSGAALSSIPTVAASAGTELPHATLTRHTSTNAKGGIDWCRAQWARPDLRPVRFEPKKNEKNAC